LKFLIYLAIFIFSTSLVYAVESETASYIINEFSASDGIVNYDVGTYNISYGSGQGSTGNSSVGSLDIQEGIYYMNENENEVNKSGVITAYPGNTLLNIGSDLLLSGNLTEGFFGTINLSINGILLNSSGSENITNTYTFNSLGVFNVTVMYSGAIGYNSAEDSFIVTVETAPVPSTGGAYDCNIRSYGNRINNTHTLVSIAVLNSTGSKQNKSLVANCYELGVLGQYTPTINQLSTGYYYTLVNSTRDGFCWIESYTNSCALTTVSWNNIWSWNEKFINGIESN